MFCIIIYDVSQNKVSKVCNFLRRYLNWVQNSVFEGELGEAAINEIKAYLGTVLDKNIDSVFIYLIRSEKEVKKEIIGIEKVNISRIL